MLGLINFAAPLQNLVNLTLIQLQNKIFPEFFSSILYIMQYPVVIFVLRFFQNWVAELMIENIPKHLIFFATVVPGRNKLLNSIDYVSETLALSY